MSCFEPFKLNSLLVVFAAVAIEGTSAHDMGCDGNPVPGESGARAAAAVSF
jgi:hypothetical protein